MFGAVQLANLTPCRAGNGAPRHTAARKPCETRRFVEEGRLRPSPELGRGGSARQDVSQRLARKLGRSANGLTVAMAPKTVARNKEQRDHSKEGEGDDSQVGSTGDDREPCVLHSGHSVGSGREADAGTR